MSGLVWVSRPLRATKQPTKWPVPNGSIHIKFLQFQPNRNWKLFSATAVLPHFSTNEEANVSCDFWQHAVFFRSPVNGQTGVPTQLSPRFLTETRRFESYTREINHTHTPRPTKNERHSRANPDGHGITSIHNHTKKHTYESARHCSKPSFFLLERWLDDSFQDI